MYIYAKPHYSAHKICNLKKYVKKTTNKISKYKKFKAKRNIYT